MKLTKRKDFFRVPPFLHTSRSCKAINLSLLLLLLPQIAVLFLYHEIYAVLNIFSSTTATLICQSIVYYKEKTTFKIPLEALLQGLFIGFFMPINMGFGFVFICAFLGFSITRVIFGKSGRWVHSTTIILLIAYISYPDLFTFTQATKTLSAEVTPLSNSPFPFISLDAYITSFLNSNILNNLGITLPQGYISLFWNTSSLIPACRYNLLTIIASIIFLSFKIYDYTISIVFIFVYSFFVYCFSNMSEVSFLSGDILSSIMGGGIMFMVFFLLGEPHSFPKTPLFKIIAGIIMAFVSFIISKEHVSFITLSFVSIIINIISPYIEEFEKAFKTKKKVINIIG